MRPRLAFILALLTLVPALPAQQEAEAADLELPSITYPWGGSRSSGTWVGVAGGAQVAISEGITWQGVDYYISLTHDLVALPAGAEHATYVRNVSAFWHRLAIVTLPQDGAEPAYAVELTPGVGSRAGGGQRELRDLATGQVIDQGEDVDAGLGTRLSMRRTLHGSPSALAQPFRLTATSAESWRTVRERLFAGHEAPDLGEVDFATEIVLVLSSGAAWNCNGILILKCFEDDERVLVRVDRSTYQTASIQIFGEEDEEEEPAEPHERPWGVAILPRRADKPYVIESNHQGYIGGPPIWKETWRLERLNPETELDALPGE